MRINKFLSTLGIASRRAIDKYIDEGKIVVNGYWWKWYYLDWW